MTTLFTEAPPAKAAKTSESIGGHWYEHANGAWTPLYKEGGTFTLREARKLKTEGRVVVPSVTTIFKLMYKKQLVDWKIANAVKMAAVLPQSDYPSQEDWVDAVVDRADQASMGAADLGSKIHKAIENYVSGQDYDSDMAVYVDAVAKKREEHGIKTSNPEVCAGSTKYGYAGRVDDHVPGGMTVIDYKSRKSRTKKVPSYETDEMQLAAYGFALFGNRFFVHGHGLIFAISTTSPGEVTVHEFAGTHMIQAFEAYLGLCQAWRFTNNFDPRVT